MVSRTKRRPPKKKSALDSFPNDHEFLLEMRRAIDAAAERARARLDEPITVEVRVAGSNRGHLILCKTADDIPLGDYTATLRRIK